MTGMRKITLTKKQKLLSIAALIIICLIVLLNLRPKPSGESQSQEIHQDIPEAEQEQRSGSKIEAYRNQTFSEWDTLEDSNSNGSVSETASAAGAKADAPGSVEQVFGEYRDENNATPPAETRPAASASGSRKREAKAAEKVAETEAAAEPQQQVETPAAPAPVKRSGSVSSLDEDVSSSLGNGFSSLDSSSRWVGSEQGKAYRCMFTRDEKVRSGQRITVRVLEDMVIDGVHIPMNTHMQGVCTITDRLEIAVTSLDMGGRIVTIGMEAFDTDGAKGIYCSDISKLGEEATQQAIATVSTGLNSRLGRVARDAATLGASIIRSKTGEVSVSIPAGYQFYIMTKKN